MPKSRRRKNRNAGRSRSAMSPAHEVASPGSPVRGADPGAGHESGPEDLWGPAQEKVRSACASIRPAVEECWATLGDGSDPGRGFPWESGRSPQEPFVRADGRDTYLAVRQLPAESSWDIYQYVGRSSSGAGTRVVRPTLILIIRVFSTLEFWLTAFLLAIFVMIVVMAVS